jgi:hypothetical protein
MIITLAAIKKRKVVTVDVTGANLECKMREGDEVLMELDEIFSQLEPTIKHFVDDKGKLCVKLKKALYICVQISRLWYKKLRGVLIAREFFVNDHDQCLC